MTRAMKMALGLCALAAAPVLAQSQTKAPKMNVIASWGDITLVHGPGTDASMDTQQAMEKMFEHWKARGFTGIYLRTDLSTNPPGSIIRSPEKTQTNAALGLAWRLIDQIMEKSDPHIAASRAAKKVGFEHWMYHPYIYSEGAPPEIGKDGVGRMVPWSYARKYHVEHPETISIDRAGNRLWMVPEYAYDGVRAEKVAEFVHMAKKYRPSGILASMRSEVSQLIDPPEHGDQYGFNQPIVDEMKKRYNVDIMTDPRFDYKSANFNINDPMLNNWRDLRGSYLTKLFAEISAGIKKVDPKIKFGITLSGEHIGPLLGNWRLEWRKWIDDGIVDTITMPVFFEATLDADAGKKGYLTHAREGIGTVSVAEVKAYIAKSKHPNVEVIQTGAPSYFYPPPPDGADGWQCDIWYDSYNSAFYQRWEQLKQDVKDFGYIKFIDQNFDTFPLSSSGNLQLGEGDMRHLPSLRAGPGVWSDFGDGSTGKAMVQNEVRRGNSGNAVLLKTAGFTGIHFASPDRGRYTGMLDPAPANGKMRTEMWIRRDNDKSNVQIVVNGTIANEKDVGLRVGPAAGRVDFANGDQWTQTKINVPVGEWTKIRFDLDIDARTYAAYVGEKETMVCEKIAFAPPKDRFIEEHGVNIPIKVPAYRIFNVVSFEPGGNADNKVYLDDVTMHWTPTMHFVDAGPKVLFQETFEKQKPGVMPAGGRGEQGMWKVKGTAAPATLQLQRTMSYGPGSKCFETDAPAVLTADIAKPAASGATVIDLDVFIRSDKSFPYILPDPTTKSAQGAVVGLYAAGSDKPVAALDSAKGTWQMWDGAKWVDTGKIVTYDVWNHVQLSIDPATKTSKLVTQPIGELPTMVGTAPLADAAPKGPLSLRVESTAAKPNNQVCFDNIIVTGN